MVVVKMAAGNHGVAVHQAHSRFRKTGELAVAEGELAVGQEYVILNHTMISLLER